MCLTLLKWTGASVTLREAGQIPRRETECTHARSDHPDLRRPEWDGGDGPARPHARGR
ncbi:hypothetical protein PLANTIT3_61532 [Plantibacter sp. T3]|nr:hypothetical protein PLANTIT3_61532 [Plantibacter sp. T3]